MNQHRRRSALGVLASGCMVATFASVPAQASPADPSNSASSSSAAKDRSPAFTDPRSGAALNREAAKTGQGAGTAPSTAGPGLAPTMPSSLVNDPTTDNTPQDTQSETTITTAGPNLVAAYNDSGSYINGEAHFTGYSVSTDGGATWNDQGALPDSAEGDAGDPVLAHDETTGRVYLVALGFNTGTQLQLFRSDDNGVTFGAPVNPTPGFQGTGAFQDKDWITVDSFPGAGQGNVYVAWRQFGGPNEGVKLTRSLDGGDTFGPSQGTMIDPGDGQGVYVVVSPDHCVSVFYLDDILGGNVIKTRKSCDQGVTFGEPVTVADEASTGVNGDLMLNGGLRSNGFPSVAVNPVNGDMYVAYNDLTANRGADVFLRSSSDGGATWSGAKRINTDGTDNDQFFPAVAVRTDGAGLMVGWYDRANDPNNLNIQRYSRVGVFDFNHNRLSMPAPFQLSPSFPVVIGQDPVINTTYMGDYDQIAADDTNFYTTWGDNRDSDAFNAYQPDVRFALVPSNVSLTNIGVTLTEASDPVAVGTEASYTATVTNSSAVAADNVFLNSPLPFGASYQSATTDSGICYQLDTNVSCALGTIAPGASVTVTLNLLPLQPGGIVARVSVTTSTGDRAPQNNAAFQSTRVTRVPTTSETFSTGDLAVPIPDNSTVDIPLDVPSTSNVALNVTAGVRLDHTYDADLDISLIAPDGTEVPLSSDNGGSGDNYGTGPNSCSGTPTVFDDSASTSITVGTAPFPGSYQPEGSLADLAGTNYGGTWILRVTDDAGGDTGTVGCFTLTIQHRTGG